VNELGIRLIALDENESQDTVGYLLAKVPSQSIRSGFR
jgi:hypothetical protein